MIFERIEKMKQAYIKPEIEQVVCNLLEMIAESTNQTEWHTGTDGQGDDTPVGPEQPNPNSDDAKGFNLWDDWE